ncbi:putative response regulatory protein [Vibrio sp. MACH09]|uniref:two-component system response regulator BtsR n=1 Tax=unclassified Vibrio TaxID=2614977 RepID=UPI001493D2CB|nr:MULTISPECIES: two-component system response regulator BtsR [unclassified Vibrio]NOI64793.1 two-component system response regulator BtsR [Vibrio sp. 99-8-1]GLO61781.1 putative response regulatory protein [Vibrio sp. MACH09]
MLTALVIDDELLAQEELTELLHETNQINVLDKASNAIEGLKKINSLKPDVVFLDIQMPQISGIELLAMLDQDTMPSVVFVTAFDQYAIQAFEDNAFDYLLKPIDTCRLNKTISRLVKQHEKELKQADITILAPSYLEQIPCIGHNRIVIIASKDVEMVYSDISGVHVQSAHLSASSQLTLKTLEEKTNLLRCHRQYLVNTNTIKEIKLLENGLAEIITNSDHVVPVSRRHLKVLKEKLGII